MPQKKITRRRRLTNISSFSRLADTVVLRVSSGSSTIVKYSDLHLPRSRPFRVTRVAYQATNDTKPLVLNMRFYGPQSTSDTTTTSGPICINGVPRRGVFQNRTKLFYPSGTPDSTQLFVIDSLCVDKTFIGVSGTVVAKFIIQLGPEEIQEACPTILLPEPNTDEYDTCVE